ncbi:MAG: hypothetical protein QNJ98_13430 [Planctomycetota bacterium]|nr:hypothetical protein [Planctomycetota bacterium]
MTDEQAPDNAPSLDSDQGLPAVSGGGEWARWLAWGWVVLIGLVALAELADWADLRAALDLQRLFRP